MNERLILSRCVTEEVTSLLYTLFQVVPRTPMTSPAVLPQTVKAVMKRSPSLIVDGDESKPEDVHFLR